MIAIVKVLLTLALVITLLQRKINIGNAMLAGAGVLFILAGTDLAVLKEVGQSMVLTASTWEILLALYLVMCLEFQLRTHGIIDGLMVAARTLFKSDKLLLALMPAFLGFLPSLGGAIFSAPLVEAAGKPYNLSPERKTAINYWFRHLWECSNPILPALLLASQIVHISTGALIASMMWVPVLGILLGWFIYIAPLKRSAAMATAAAAAQPAVGNYRALILAGGPILANFFLVVGLDLGPATAMLLVVATMLVVLRMPTQRIIDMLKESFDRKMFWGVVGILFFQYMLKGTGIIGDVAAVLQQSGIPLLLVLGAVGFLSGMLTGTSQGFVAITFPLAAAIASGDVTVAALAYVAGAAGQMLSPAHLCLLVTLDYFKADFLRTLRSVTLIEACVLVALSVKTTFL